MQPKPLPPMPDPTVARNLARDAIHKAQRAASIRPGHAVKPRAPPDPPSLDTLTR